MNIHLARLSVIIAAIASVVNLALTITSDAQTGYDDLQATIHRIEARQIKGCR